MDDGKKRVTVRFLHFLEFSGIAVAKSNLLPAREACINPTSGDTGRCRLSAAIASWASLTPPILNSQT